MYFKQLLLVSILVAFMTFSEVQTKKKEKGVTKKIHFFKCFPLWFMVSISHVLYNRNSHLN